MSTELVQTVEPMTYTVDSYGLFFVINGRPVAVDDPENIKSLTHKELHILRALCEAAYESTQDTMKDHAAKKNAPEPLSGLMSLFGGNG